jgi:uncharacterized protein involved in outer membrane biogenesis
MPSSRKPPKNLPGKFKVPFIILAVLLVLGLILQLTLPYFLLRFANQKLSEIPEYRGHIAGIGLSLLRGAYTLEDVRLEKLNAQVPVPFFSARKVDLSVEWRALFHGKLVSEIDLYDPRLNFVTGPSDASETGIDTLWRQKVEDLLPFQINHFGIHGGEIHFRDYQSKPTVDIHIDHLEAVAEGLTNSAKTSNALPASLRVTAQVMDDAALRLNLKLAPLAVSPTFYLSAEVRDLQLRTLNDFLQAYADVQLSQGNLSVFTEMTGSDGRFKGYVKPLAKDIKILNRKKDNLPHRLWEATVTGVTKLFENPPKAQIATQIPLSGSFSDPHTGTWTAIGYLLRNAFIQALQPQLNHSIHFGDASPQDKPVIVEVPDKK